MQQPGFWDAPRKSAPLLRRRRALERRRKTLERLNADRDEIDAWLELLAEDAPGAEDDAELGSFIDRVGRQSAALDLELKLSGEDDDRNALLAIHPGEGGTDSQDWAEILLRMYLRWAEQSGFDVRLLERLDGEEAGLKSATVAVRGEYAFGRLRGESGVHRLVRISPFDAAKRRHTSFASVYAYPEVEDDIDIEVEDKEIRIDTFRSSGAGGQHVNVTDSAVRITHLPTGIVASCQNERSQIKNRSMAMKILKARLYDREVQKRREEQAEREGQKMEIGFGSQIRSYVLHPYRMVKDHRTRLEVSAVERVLDGDLDPFIDAWLGQQLEAPDGGQS
jgi:peptide chain release factor 2